MDPFVINSLTDSEANPFDRQQRISWWNQENITNAKIMVVGAGAIGNETLKNLALLGAANIFIVDFDTISTSNLSRTVLYRKTDIGRRKAEAAAERMRDLCIAENPKIDWFHGDLVWELGTGLYRAMDIVLACLDNVEARCAINRQCMLAGTPWIDAGINELGMHVTTFRPPEVPCYECNMTLAQHQAARRRYSCDDFKRAMFHEGKVATVQITSAIASAIQVQEAIKLICGQHVASSKKIYYQGTVNDFDVYQLPGNPQCQAHVAYPNPRELALSSDITLRALLHAVSDAQLSGQGAVLDLTAYGWSFVSAVGCKSCGDRIDLARASFRIYDVDTICERCRGLQTVPAISDAVPTEKTVVSEFSLLQSEESLLCKTLRDLGIPLWPVLAIKDASGNYSYYELSADKSVLLPNIAVAS